MQCPGWIATLIFVSAVGTPGCTTTIRPPTNPENPVSVFVIDYGRHSSLVLPRDDDQGLREYAYGDWNWYALARDGIFDVFPTLFLSTQGTLGRLDWHIEPKKESVDRYILCEEVLEIPVSRNDAQALLAELDARYESHLDTQIESDLYHLFFVHHDEPYHVFNSCNLVMVRWLKSLGCKIDGYPILADFRIAEQH